MPTYMKTGMVGGGMFGVRTQVPSSSVRSGAGVAEEDEEEGAKEEEDGWGTLKKTREKVKNGGWRWRWSFDHRLWSLLTEAVVCSV